MTGAAHPEARLTGRFDRDEHAAGLDGIMLEIDDARREEAARQLRMAQRE